MTPARVASLRAALFGFWLCAWAPVAMAAPTKHPPPSDEEMIRAVDSANEVQVKRFLDQGGNPNARDDRGEPALIYALHHERFETADLLASWPGTDIEAENKEGQTALMVASFLGRLDLVNVLLSRGAEVSHSGWTALHYAASSGQLDVTKVLIEHSAYIDALSPNGTTALMMAARHKDQPVCDYLLQQGADPTPKNGADMTAADFALKAGDEKLAKHLQQSALSWRASHSAPVIPAASTSEPLDAPSDSTSSAQ
jgi:ankyrin repeat protein